MRVFVVALEQLFDPFGHAARLGFRAGPGTVAGGLEIGLAGRLSGQFLQDLAASRAARGHQEDVAFGIDQFVECEIEARLPLAVPCSSRHRNRWRRGACSSPATSSRASRLWLNRVSTKGPPLEHCRQRVERGQVAGTDADDRQGRCFDRILLCRNIRA